MPAPAASWMLHCRNTSPLRGSHDAGAVRLDSTLSLSVAAGAGPQDVDLPRYGNNNNIFFKHLPRYGNNNNIFF